MNIEDAKPGMKVRYIPGHAGKNIYHPSCEDGIINSVGEINIFVNYYTKSGILNTSTQSTSPEDLIIFDFEKDKESDLVDALSELESFFDDYKLHRDEISWGYMHYNDSVLNLEIYLTYKPWPLDVVDFFKGFDFIYDRVKNFMDGKIMFKDGSYMYRDASCGKQWWSFVSSKMPSRCRRR